MGHYGILETLEKTLPFENTNVFETWLIFIIQFLEKIRNISELKEKGRYLLNSTTIN